MLGVTSVCGMFHPAVKAVEHFESCVCKISAEAEQNIADTIKSGNG